MNEQQSLLPISIGERFRIDREKQGHDLASVAAELHVPLDVLTMLEDGQTIEVAPVYLRGYVRSYARFLGFSDQEIDEALVGIDDGEPEVQSIFEAPPRVNPVDRWLRVTSYVLATLLIGTLAWQFSHEAVRLSQGNLSAQSEGSASNAAADPVATEQPAPNAAMASMDLMRQPRGSAGEEAWAAIDSAASLNSEDAARRAAGDQLIGLSTSADSWVEIRDANGRQLVMDLLRAGSSHQYYGVAPFDVLLGRASAIELSLDGEKVDTPAQGGDEVTRFQLGEATPPATAQPD